MGKISKIEVQKHNKNRRSYFVDGIFVIGADERVVNNLGYKVGDKVDPEKLKKEVKNFWKGAYGQKSWEVSLKRQKAIKTMIKLWGYKVKITGFGANTKEYINTHPQEKGAPDLQILDPLLKPIYLESTGCPKMRRGEDLWVRPDKLDYIEKHPEKEIWVAHMVDTTQKIRFIKPKLPHKNYYSQEYKYIRGNKELYCVILENAEEVFSAEDFKKILERLEKKDIYTARDIT